MSWYKINDKQHVNRANVIRVTNDADRGRVCLECVGGMTIHLRGLETHEDRVKVIEEFIGITKSKGIPTYSRVSELKEKCNNCSSRESRKKCSSCLNASNFEYESFGGLVGVATASEQPSPIAIEDDTKVIPKKKPSPLKKCTACGKRNYECECEGGE